ISRSEGIGRDRAGLAVPCGSKCSEDPGRHALTGIVILDFGAGRIAYALASPADPPADLDEPRGDSPPFSKWVFRGLGLFGWQGSDRRWSWPRAWRRRRR